MNEELDSQLSAMFDNELPAGQCELLARRLSRDEELKGRWGRYAAIGATIRAEGGPRLNIDLARRVSVAISAEPPVEATELAGGVPSVVTEKTAGQGSRSNLARWWAPAGGVAVAASVAAAAILWLRYESPLQDAPAIAQVTSVPGGSVVTQNASTTPDNRSSYVVPKTTPRRSVVLSSQLANYVVAHSEFSSPVNRRNLLSALMSSEGTVGAQSGSEEPTEDVNDDATSPQ